MSGPSIVDELLRNSFASRSYVEKVKIVQDGRPKPDLKWEAQVSGVVKTPVYSFTIPSLDCG